MMYNMRLYSYIQEEESIEILTSWEYQNQLHGFNSLKEMFDKEVEFGKVVSTNKSLMLNFSTSNDDWIFKSFKVSKNNDIYGILFNKVGDKPEDMFKSKGDKEYIGEVFAGVFRCIEKLIDDRNVNGIAFKTTDNKLSSLYKRMSKWVIKRFPDFIFQKELHKKNPTEFLYMRKGIEIDETTAVSGIAKNTAKGHVQVIGPNKKKKKKGDKNKLTGIRRMMK
jgi:hypothetical protein